MVGGGVAVAEKVNSGTGAEVKAGEGVSVGIGVGVEVAKNGGVNGFDSLRPLTARVGVGRRRGEGPAAGATGAGFSSRQGCSAMLRRNLLRKRCRSPGFWAK